MLPAFESIGVKLTCDLGTGRGGFSCSPHYLVVRTGLKRLQCFGLKWMAYSRNSNIGWYHLFCSIMSVSGQYWRWLLIFLFQSASKGVNLMNILPSAYTSSSSLSLWRWCHEPTLINGFIFHYSIPCFRYWALNHVFSLYKLTDYKKRKH